MEMYHYTCDCGRDAIGDHGFIVPAAQRAPQLSAGPGQFAWFTDMAIPLRGMLGLTSNYLTCDRTAYRYAVLRPDEPARWITVRRSLPRGLVESLESSPGARPMHWWVSREPVEVVYRPVVERVA